MSPAQVPKIGMLGGEHPQRLGEAEGVHELAHGGALAAGDHQAVQAGQLLRKPDLDRVRAEAAQHRDMLPKGPLESEDAYAGRAGAGRRGGQGRQGLTNRDAG